MVEPDQRGVGSRNLGGSTLIASARRWIDEALRAWANDDYGKVAALAPVAVEHLGKAVLWQTNPVLLVPLNHDAEHSLFTLAVNPDLASPKLRTIGLSIVLRRLDQLLQGLPIDPKRRSRMTDVRNGAMHVGTPAQSRQVLFDALGVLAALLDRLGEDPDEFYGDHQYSVRDLLDQKRTEVGHRVTAKRARARRHLTELEERLGREVFEEATDRLQELAVDFLDPGDFGLNLWAVDADCPECGMRGRLFGEVDVDAEIDVDVEPLGGGQYAADPYAYWITYFAPSGFSCHVCKLTLSGRDELGEARLPNTRHQVEEGALGDGFDPADVAQQLYAPPD